MTEFVLMQDPAKWVTSKKGYQTIGLKELYPEKGFSKCNKYGHTDFLGPIESDISYFAFIDEESEKAFKGDIKYFTELFSEIKIKFAKVKLQKSIIPS